MLPYSPRHLPVSEKENIQNKISKEEWGKYLQEEKNSKLNLAYQNLQDVPEKMFKKYSHRLKELDLSYNAITDFRFLLDLPNLETLILDHNGIISQVKFPTLPRLVVIVKHVSSCFPNLKYLSLMNNEAAPSYFNGGTFEQYKDYRHYVISQLPNLTMLDDTVVSAEEREEAERIYKRMAMEPPNTSKKQTRIRKTKKKSRSKSVEDDFSPQSPIEVHNKLMSSLPAVEGLSCSYYSLENAAVSDGDEQFNEHVNNSPQGQDNKSIDQPKLRRDPVMDSLPDLTDLDIYNDLPEVDQIDKDPTGG